jgi:Zn-dependent protease/predicted transcriptional regulator
MVKDRRFPLVTLLGFQIRFDLTWLILVALVVWSLSAGYFPASYADLPTSTHVWMGIVGAIGLFASIVLHELAHSWVGRRLGMKISGITLFVFGGAAELTEEPKSARTEFLMAAAGPLASLILAALFQLLAWAIEAGTRPTPITGVLHYLAGINLILAVFNLLPAFPLDGGRILRAALWGWRGELLWATRVAAAIGGAIGLLLVGLGIVTVLGGNIVGGMWSFLIGLFIRSAALGSRQQLIAKHVLERISVRDMMIRDPVSIAPDEPVERAVELFLTRNLKFLPVTENGRALGQIGLKEVKSLTPAERSQKRVRQAMTPFSPDGAIALRADAATALAQMQRIGHSRLLVVENGRLEGIICLKDLLDQLTLRSELAPMPPQSA